MTRPPGDDPAAFAIELETLARKSICGRRRLSEVTVSAR